MFERIANFVTHVGTIYAFIIAIFGAVIIGYVTYDGFIKSIEENKKQIEITQMMILNPFVRQAENNPCRVSDRVWEEYIMYGSLLQELKQKHTPLSKNYPFTPIKRVRKNEEPPKCKD